MKKYYLSFILLVAGLNVLAQNLHVLDANQYDLLKRSNQLPSQLILKHNEELQQVVFPRVQPSANTLQNNTICNCLMPLDTSFSVVAFNSGAAPDYRNDDGSSPAIVLPFSFCFFGQSFDTLYINNNGNISFGSPRFNFISDSFPNNVYTMIAPLWADVDTRGALSGMVYYKVTSSAVIIKWEHVGYFPLQDNLLNTFQIILTDGTDPLVPAGNAALCYGDMQWTSGGIGLNGAPATAGANAGDGINFIQFGRFNDAGYGYDGPFGANDSVDWLDSSSFAFDLCPANVPPVPFDCNNDTVYLRVGDIDDLTFSFISPQLNRFSSIQVNSGNLQNFITLSNSSGNLAVFKGRLTASSANIGNNLISITATDNSVPPQSVTLNRVIHIDQATGINNVHQNPDVFFMPNPFTEQSQLSIPKLTGRKATLIISDISGREICRYENVESGFILEKTNLSKGMYLFRVTDLQELNVTGKITVK